MGHWVLAVTLLGWWQPGLVRPGLEVLLTDSLHLVRGKRIALVANHATVDRQGVHGVERLRAAGVTLVTLMSPEHGFRGAAAPGEEVTSSVDSATGLPIYSLYGKRLGPTAEVLSGIDVILVDLPDVGTRYFTYLSTTVEVMKAAAKAGKPVLVLDRPNPLGGRIEGPVLDTAFASFVGRLAIPVRPGLTLGEQALLANTDLKIGAAVTVIPVSGWRRRDDAFTTGLPFLPPSPNLKTLESLFHYPGTCLFEGTALSVGRGTDAPFEQVGAPWLDTTRVLAIVRRSGLRGVRFAGVPFTPLRPGDGKFADTVLAGIRLTVTDREKYRPVTAALTLLAAVYQVHGAQIGLIPAHFDRLAGGVGIRRWLLARHPVADQVKSWRNLQREFVRRTREIRLYRE